MSLKEVKAKFDFVDKTVIHKSVNFLGRKINYTRYQKDAIPTNDCYTVSEMLRFCQLVPGFVNRGFIKEKEIKNGERNVDIVDFKSVAPH